MSGSTKTVSCIFMICCYCLVSVTENTGLLFNLCGQPDDWDWKTDEANCTNAFVAVVICVDSQTTETENWQR